MDKNTTFFLIAQKKTEASLKKNAPAITIAVPNAVRVPKRRNYYSLKV